MENVLPFDLMAKEMRTSCKLNVRALKASRPVGTTKLYYSTKKRQHSFDILTYRTKKTFKYVDRMLPLFRKALKGEIKTFRTFPALIHLLEAKCEQ